MEKSTDRRPVLWTWSMGSTDWVYTPSVGFNPGRVLTIKRLETGGAVLPAQGHRRGWRAVEKSPEHHRNGAPGG